MHHAVLAYEVFEHLLESQFFLRQLFYFLNVFRLLVWRHLQHGNVGVLFTDGSQDRFLPTERQFNWAIYRGEILRRNSSHINTHDC